MQEIAETGELPVPMFCAGGIATPADASLVMQLGAQAVFVGSGIFKSDDPAPRARAIVEAATNFEDPNILARASRGLGNAMPGLEMGELETPARRSRLVAATDALGCVLVMSMLLDR